MKKVYIGIAGYSGKKFSEGVAKNMIQKDFNYLSDKYSDREVVIVSGLTNIGIPALAYACAASMGFFTMGIACSKAKDYECFECDYVNIVGNNWGEESESFLNIITELYTYGGGSQTKEEIVKAEARGIEVYERMLEEIK
jgi:hypothetical protein